MVSFFFSAYFPLEEEKKKSFSILNRRSEHEKWKFYAQDKSVRALELFP